MVAWSTVVMMIIWQQIGTVDCDGFVWHWYHALQALAFTVVPFMAGLLANERPNTASSGQSNSGASE
jgi:hypothetical protein